MYVYIKSEPQLYTVGFYRPDGTWDPESDHETAEKAADRVHWLNGGHERKSEICNEHSDEHLRDSPACLRDQERDRQRYSR